MSTQDYEQSVTAKPPLFIQGKKRQMPNLIWEIAFK
jgi:hypothetical protein